MRNAPSVMYPVGRCALHLWLLAVSGASGALVLVGWWWHTRQAWLGMAGVLVWLVWLGVALRSVRRAPVGHLRWRPAPREVAPALRGTWIWHHGPDADGVELPRLDVALDLQDWMLLRCGGSPATTSLRWLWVERCRDPARWSDLRRALVASRN